MLVSKNIYLSPLFEEDCLKLFEWINDRNLVIYNTNYRPIHEINQKKWFNEITQRNDISIFGIRLKKTKELIGTCQLCSIDFVNNTSELRIRIGNEKLCGKGYGTEAVGLLLRHAFLDLNMNKVYLYVFNTNERAVKSYLKCGFIKEGLMRKAAFNNGQYIDIIFMGILKEEYSDGR